MLKHQTMKYKDNNIEKLACKFKILTVTRIFESVNSFFRVSDKAVTANLAAG